MRYPPGLLAPVLAALTMIVTTPNTDAGETRSTKSYASARSATSPTKVASHRTKSSKKRVATAASAEKLAKASAVAPSAPAPTAPGMVVGIDRETGAIVMPSPEQMARIRAAESRTTPPAPVLLPNGMMRLDARGWSREYVVVRRGADGKLVPSCVDGAEAARAIRQSPPPATQEEE